MFLYFYTVISKDVKKGVKRLRSNCNWITRFFTPLFLSNVLYNYILNHTLKFKGDAAWWGLLFPELGHHFSTYDFLLRHRTHAPISEQWSFQNDIDYNNQCHHNFRKGQIKEPACRVSWTHADELFAICTWEFFDLTLKFAAEVWTH